MLLAIIGIIVGIGFAIWFVLRTPENLRKWYGIPVIIVIIIFIILLIL